MKEWILAWLAVVLILGGLFLASLGIGALLISYSDQGELIEYRTDKYRILEINPPKHFILKLQRLSDNFIFEDIGVSKHCNDMLVQVGDTIEAFLKVYASKRDSNAVYNFFETSWIREQCCE